MDGWVELTHPPSIIIIFFQILGQGSLSLAHFPAYWGFFFSTTSDSMTGSPLHVLQTLLITHWFKAAGLEQKIIVNMQDGGLQGAGLDTPDLVQQKKRYAKEWNQLYKLYQYISLC